MSRPHCQTRSRNHPAHADKLRAGEERNTRWQALSTSAKVASLKKRRGFSKRQMKLLSEV